MCVKLLHSCPTLCNSMDCSLPESPVHGILQESILEWLPFPPPGDLHDPGIKSASFMSPALADRFFTTNATWEACQNVLFKNFSLLLHFISWLIKYSLFQDLPYFILPLFIQILLLFWF